MLTTAGCIPCYLKQAFNTLSLTPLEDGKKAEILNLLCAEIPKLDLDTTPAQNSSLLLHRLYELAGELDPFERAKLESDRSAMELWPELRRLIRNSSDSLLTAIKVSVAGNVVDLGILTGYDLKGSLEHTLTTDFACEDYAVFKQVLERSRHVLIIGDNSGEIAFDRLLAEELSRRGRQVTYAVKSGPVLNDATLSDAQVVGMAEVARVIETGNNFLGVVPEKSSREFLQAIEQAGCIIAKGQANYETLEGTGLAGNKAFFVLKAKCPVLAEHLGVEFGGLVFAANRGSREPEN